MCRHNNGLAKTPVAHLAGRTSTVAQRPAPREGDGSPSLRAEVESKRTDDARIKHAKALERNKRRSAKKAAECYAKEGELGLEKLIAQMQEERGGTSTSVVEDNLHLFIPQVKHGAKRIRSKPAKRLATTTTKPRIRRKRNLAALERRKSNALLREVKRIFKKALSFAARQCKKYGHSLYWIILGLFCLRCQDLIPKNLQEAT